MADPEKINILVVDDLPEKLLVFETVLEELGQNVVIARSGSEALRRIMEMEFAVILLDVNMPSMDGYETAALIRQRKKTTHIPIIFITAYADEVHTAQGYDLGAVDFILSPVVPEILRTKVKVFVDLFRMTQQVRYQAEEQVALAREHAARSAAEETVRRLKFLAEASKTLASSLDLEATLRSLLGLVVTRAGDVAVVTLLNDQRVISQSELAWMEAGDGIRTRTLAGLEWAQPAFAEAIQQAIAEGLPRYLPEDASERSAMPLWKAFCGGGAFELPAVELKAMGILPLLARGRVLGTLSLALEHSHRRHDRADIALIEDLAHRAAIAIDNARLYHDIQEADHRKNEFLSMLAHELRNPLAPLLNGIDILRLYGPKQVEIQKVQDMMDRQVHHLVRLVDDLLDISRITRGKIQLQMEAIEVSVVVDRAIEVSRPLLDARHHELTISLPPTPIRVHADPVRLAQVLSNLLNNAAKYTEDGGAIRLTVDQDDTDVVFCVSDNGVGISGEMLSCIFEPFTQVKRSLDRSQGGLGIGLTLVRRMVEMHGGTAKATSGGANKGSEFTIRLPNYQNSTGKSDLPDAPGDHSTDAHMWQRILVVDDNIDVADSTAFLLRQIGSEVHVCYDGPSALEAVHLFRPEIVLLDIGLPGMDGYEVARQLRRQSGLGPLVLVALSGYGQDEDRQRSLDAGFDRHLVKPASLPELKALLTFRVDR